MSGYGDGPESSKVRNLPVEPKNALWCFVLCPGGLSRQTRILVCERELSEVIEDGDGGGGLPEGCGVPPRKGRGGGTRRGKEESPWVECSRCQRFRLEKTNITSVSGTFGITRVVGPLSETLHGILPRTERSPFVRPDKVSTTLKDLIRSVVVFGFL